MDNRPIGVFDSGVGGLTVVSQIFNHLNNEKIIYMGDTARLPYGSKSKETVTKYSLQICRFLLTKGVKAIIVACNTASSNSLEYLQKEFDIPIFGMVEPGVTSALHESKGDRIGIIATERTVRSKAYENLIQKKSPETIVYSKSCPLFVSLVEEGFFDNEIAELTVKHYLDEFINKNIDSLVLGCTHYPLLKNCIQKVMGKIKIIDPAETMAKELKHYLHQHDLLNENIETPRHDFYLSDNTDKFDFIARTALNKEYIAQIIDIEKY